MGKDVTVQYRDYTGIERVFLPLTAGGTAEFVDTTDANASASDIASGKTAYVNGVKITGTNPGVKTATGTFTGNGTRQVQISCNFEPDLVYWYGDPGTEASSGTVSGMIVRGMLAANQYRNNTTSNSNNIQTNITAMNTGGSSYNFRATYSDGSVTLYCFSSNARSLFTNNRSYSYTFVKWTA